MVSYGIQITEKPADFEKKVLRAFVEELNVQVPPLLSKMEIAIKNRTDKFFLYTPEAQALISGPLDAHFGFPVGEGAVRVGSIIRTIVNNIEVTLKPFNMRSGRITGGIEVGVLVADFQDVLSNPEAVVITAKGEKLEWLKWLLIEGDRIIITSYEIAFGGYPNSRSGKAIMKQNSSGIWRVPPQYSGTVRQNWLTRAILNASTAYLDMVSSVMETEFKRIF